MKTPSQSRTRREEIDAFYDLVLYSSHHPLAFTFVTPGPLLQITLIGQGVRLATLDPSGHVTIWNDKREQLSLNVAIIPRLVKYGQKYQSQSLNNAVFRDEFVEVFDRFWLYRTDQSITRSREVKILVTGFQAFSRGVICFWIDVCLDSLFCKLCSALRRAG